MRTQRANHHQDTYPRISRIIATGLRAIARRKRVVCGRDRVRVADPSVRAVDDQFAATVIPRMPRARSIAAAWVVSTALAREAPGFLTCQSPSGRRVTRRSFRLLMLITFPWLAVSKRWHEFELQQGNPTREYFHAPGDPLGDSTSGHRVPGSVRR